MPQRDRLWVKLVTFLTNYYGQRKLGVSLGGCEVLGKMWAGPKQEIYHSLHQDLWKATATQSTFCLWTHSRSFYNYSHSRSAKLRDQQHKCMTNIKWSQPFGLKHQTSQDDLPSCSHTSVPGIQKEPMLSSFLPEYRSNCFGNVGRHAQLKSISTNRNEKRGWAQKLCMELETHF